MGTFTAMPPQQANVDESAGFGTTATHGAANNPGLSGTGSAQGSAGVSGTGSL